MAILEAAAGEKRKKKTKKTTRSRARYDKTPHANRTLFVLRHEIVFFIPHNGSTRTHPCRVYSAASLSRAIHSPPMRYWYHQYPRIDDVLKRARAQCTLSLFTVKSVTCYSLVK